jgi:SNF2 family DNA or RNA helicase
MYLKLYDAAGFGFGVLLQALRSWCTYFSIFMQDDWDPDWQSTTSSKVAYLVEKLRSLRDANIKHGHSTNITSGAGLVSNNLQTTFPSTLPDKVIIFSQFLEHIHVIEQQVNFKAIFIFYRGV